MIVEIDNSYPEIARPYEPIKGAKHYKRLGFPFAIAGLLLITLPAIPAQPEEEIIPVVTLEPGPHPLIPSPAPSFDVIEPEVSPVPETMRPYIRPVRPVPSPEPSPVPTVIPSPSPRPNPTPTEEPVEDDVTVEIIGNNDTVVYSGYAQGVRGYTYTVYVNGEEADSSLFDVVYAGTDDMPAPYVEGTEPGIYEMGLTEESFTVSSDTYDVYGVSVEDGWLKILDETATLTVVITGNTETVTYDGTSHSVDGYTVTAYDADGEVTDYTVTLNTPGQDHASGTLVGTYPMGMTTELSAADFTVDTVYPNVDIQFTNGWLTIEKAPVTVTVTGATATVVYDGQVHVVNGYTVSIPADSGLTEADIIGPSVDLASASGTEVDTYPMNLQTSYFRCRNDNYEVTFSIEDGWLKIVDRRTALVTITVNSAPNHYTYDGTVHSVYGYTYTAVDGTGSTIDSSLISVSMDTPSKAGVEGINAGSYTTSVEAADFAVSSSSYDSCEVVSVVQGTLVIDPASLTVTITGAAQTVPYDGEEHRVTGYTISIPGGATITESEIIGPASAAAVGTEVGTYSMGLTEDSFSTENTNYNVTFSVTDGSLVITPPSTEHVPPDVSINNEVSVIGDSGNQHVWVGFNINAWNDLSDGTMIAELSIVDDDDTDITTIIDGTDKGTMTIAGSSGTSYAELQFITTYWPAGRTSMPVIKANINLTYNYSDGTVETAVIGPAVIRTGTFAQLDPSYGVNGATADEVGPIFDLIIDDSQVDPADVGIEYSSLVVNGNYVSGQPLMRRYTGDDGKPHMQLAYIVSGMTFPADIQWTVYLKYDDGTTVWTPSVSYSGTINE